MFFIGLRPITTVNVAMLLMSAICSAHETGRVEQAEVGGLSCAPQPCCRPPVQRSSCHSSASRGKMLAFLTDLCRREAAEWMINMKKKEYEDLQRFMIERMNDTVHDKLHVYRVVHYAVQIAEKTVGAEFDIVLTAALLHDIGRPEELRDSTICHAQAGSKMAKDFLLSKGYDNHFSERVSACILSHRHKKGITPESIEAKIVFDADKLDLIGNVGIARAILFGGQIDEPFYVLDHDGLPTEGLPNEPPSLFREYHRKLCCLSDRLYTDAGKEIALKQQESMNCYFEGLIQEVNNNYLVGNDLLKKHIKQ